MNSLAAYEKEYETIMSSDFATETKDLQLVALMTKMEVVFKIPYLHNPEWDKQHPEVIALYRKISNSRIM